MFNRPCGSFQAKMGGNQVIDRRAEASIDEADDSEGYYRVILGEMLDAGRYHVHANLGKGMFSSVVRAKDMQNGGKEVAIKIIRSQETMCVRIHLFRTVQWLMRSSAGTKLGRRRPAS